MISSRLCVMSNPNSVLSRSGIPETCGTSQGWRNSHRLAAKANARVVMARARPRIRSAGSPMTRLAMTAPAMPSRTARGSGTEKSALARAVTKAPTPMSATWASEIWPAQCTSMWRPATATTAMAIWTMTVLPNSDRPREQANGMASAMASPMRWRIRDLRTERSVRTSMSMSTSTSGAADVVVVGVAVTVMPSSSRWPAGGAGRRRPARRGPLRAGRAGSSAGSAPLRRDRGRGRRRGRRGRW